MGEIEFSCISSVSTISKSFTQRKSKQVRFEEASVIIDHSSASSELEVSNGNCPSNMTLHVRYW